MTSGDVDYDSIEVEDNEEDEKLTAKIKQQIKSGNNDASHDLDKTEMKEWLTKHRLGEYYAIFIEKGYESLQQLTNLNDNILLTQIGVTKLVHRRKLIAKLKQYSQQ